MPKEVQKPGMATRREKRSAARGAESTRPTTTTQGGNPRFLRIMKRMLDQTLNPLLTRINQLENSLTSNNGEAGSQRPVALRLDQMDSDMTLASGRVNSRGVVENFEPVAGGSTGFRPVETNITQSNTMKTCCSQTDTVERHMPMAYYPTMPINNLEKPKFPSQKQHPVTFIEDLCAYLKRMPAGFNNEIDLIIECLDGGSRSWARVYRERWTNFEDFKRDFLETYWGEAEQGELRKKIVHGTWNRSGTSMLNYFITLCGQAKMLTYPIQETQLINDIIHHFPKDVQYAWTTSQNKTIIEASEFLRKLDNVNRGEVLNSTLRIPSSSHEQNNNSNNKAKTSWQFKKQALKPVQVPPVDSANVNIIEDLTIPHEDYDYNLN